MCKMQISALGTVEIKLLESLAHFSVRGVQPSYNLYP